MEELTVIEPKKTRRRKASIKQIRMVQYRNQGYSKSKAARLAGYSSSSIKQITRVWNAKSIKDILLGMKEKLLDAGLTQEYWVAKIAEWAEDKNVANQIKAHNLWKEYMVESDSDKNKPGQIKRKLTLEEFTVGPNWQKDLTFDRASEGSPTPEF